MKKFNFIFIGIVILALLGVFFLFFKSPLGELNPLCSYQWNKVKAKMDAASRDCQSDEDCISLSCGCYGPETARLYNHFSKVCNPPRYACVRPPCKCRENKCTEYFPEMRTLDEVWEVAREGLPRFLGLISVGDLKDFGFEGLDELEVATLSDPYEVYTISTESLRSYSKESKVAFLLSSTNQWYFPVMVNNEPRVMLTVAQSEGKWQVVDLGGTSLPRNLHTLEARLPDLLSEEGFQGNYSTKLVRIFPSNIYFVLVETTTTSSSSGSTESSPRSTTAYTREFIVVPDDLVSQWLGIQSYKLYAPETVMPKVVDLTIRSTN